MATIEELSAALVKADAAGNTADAKAFADAIRQMRSSQQPVAAPAQPETGIPGPRQPGFFETLVKRPLDVLEVPIAVGANIATGLPVYLSGAFGPEAQRAVARNIQYQPRGELAQAALEGLGRAAEASKIPPFMPQLAGFSPARVPSAAETRVGVAKALGPSEAKLARMTAEDYARGPQIDAAAQAQRLGIALNPTDIQPSVGAKVLSAAAGPRAPEALANVNKTRVREIALNELGLPSTAQLNTPQAFQQARKQVAKPYEEVAKLPIQQADDAMVQRLEALRADLDVIGAKEYAPAIGKIVDDAIAKTQTGLTGEQLLKNISVLRERARKTYNNKSATTEALDIADTNLKVATELESLIENSITNPKLLDQFRDARQKMARSYAYEGATDLNTGILDVKKLARITSKDNNLTGDIAALGQIAGNFPDVFTSAATPGFFSVPRLSRSGAMGASGALAASPFGLTASIAGGLAGGALGEIGGAYASRVLASPGYQRSLTLRDLRQPVTNQLAAQINYGPNQMVPYQAPVEVLMPGQGPYQPNFTFVQEPGQPRVTPARPDMTRALPAPSAEGTLNALRAEDARRAGVSRALGREAEARAAAAEAAGRRPAAGEVILELDPVTGRLREASQGLKGATPETFSDFGASLASAANKATAGRAFDMTAAEKVAWNKTKVDLAEVAPGFKALNDKAIAEKMMDRAWVEQTAVKAREKAAAFEQLAARAANERARQTAMANRERMLDLAEQMEEGLRAARPDVSGKQQGPKTRAAQRNRLISDQEVLNKLLEK